MKPVDEVGTESNNFSDEKKRLKKPMLQKQEIINLRNGIQCTHLTKTCSLPHVKVDKYIFRIYALLTNKTCTPKKYKNWLEI